MASTTERIIVLLSPSYMFLTIQSGNHTSHPGTDKEGSYIILPKGAKILRFCRELVKIH